jgi:signal transduction histidine kinase
MPFSSLLQNDNRSRLAVTAGRIARKLVPLIYCVSALAFLADLTRASTLAYGIIYTPLIATAVFHKRRSGLWLLTAAACALVVTGACFPVVSSDLPEVIGNRLLSIAAILATAAFVYHARDIQERLAAQTRRAAAAERIKTDVLTDLSEEIRTPLHALLSVLTLTMATSDPEVREALRRVRSDGRQLLATVDNLIDLSQVEDRALNPQVVDIATIARDAAETAKSPARERQIVVSMTDTPELDVSLAIGDAWAIRRILDNFLANAVRLTPPGGAVSVSVQRVDDRVIAAVTDTGRGLPPDVTSDFAADAPAGDGRALRSSGGAGLALSSRLAQTMNGRLTACNGAGSGATVSLWLPASEQIGGPAGGQTAFSIAPRRSLEPDRKKPRQAAGF